MMMPPTSLPRGDLPAVSADPVLAPSALLEPGAPERKTAGLPQK
jgi:hypothetical protein